MKQRLTRLLSIKLNNFKNVSKGFIEMPSFTTNQYASQESDILGIYGQNGSGKTAAIDALQFLKEILLGNPLPKNAHNFISVSSESATLSFELYISNNNFESIVNYEFVISTKNENTAFISAESIKFSKINEDNNIDSKITLIKYFNKDGKFTYSPKYRYDQLSSGSKETDIKIGVAEAVAYKENKSFIFCSEIRDLWTEAQKKDEAWFAITNALRNFAIESLFVVENKHSSIISLDFALPVAFKYVDNNTLTSGDMLVSLSEPSIFEVSHFEMLKNIINEANPVISALIPGFSIFIKEYGPQATKDGKEGIRFELMSNRNGDKIPLQYESDGIKKILSIINLLICAYNNPSFCVAFDELDAGVYEYLLGELLSVINETGKGQIIFTSHNLRPLELINKNSMRFTTTNPNNRYIKLTNVGNTNNLRDLYLRSINLGGQKEQIYEPTKEYEIRRAFRRAGNLNNG